MAIYVSKKPFDHTEIEAIQLKKNNYADVDAFTYGKVSDFQIVDDGPRQTCHCLLHYNTAISTVVKENDFVIKKDNGFFRIREYAFLEKYRLKEKGE